MKKFTVRQTFESLGDECLSTHASKEEAIEAAKGLIQEVTSMVAGLEIPFERTVGSSEEDEIWAEAAAKAGASYNSYDHLNARYPMVYGSAVGYWVANQAVKIEEEDLVSAKILEINGLKLTVELESKIIEAESIPASWREGYVIPETGIRIQCGGGYVDWPSNGDYRPFSYLNSCSHWEENLMPFLFAEWTGEDAVEVYKKIQTALAELERGERGE